MSSRAFEELLEEKDRLKKLGGLEYIKLESQSYLNSSNLTIRQKQLAFRWRTKMIKVAWNYGQKTQCPLCFEADDTQNHILSCPELYSDSLTVGSDFDLNNLEPHMKILEAVTRKREAALDKSAKKSA